MNRPGRRPILVVTRGLDPVGTGRQVELAAEALRSAGYAIADSPASLGSTMLKTMQRKPSSS